jgi:hypothetical protein
MLIKTGFYIFQQYPTTPEGYFAKYQGGRNFPLDTVQSKNIHLDLYLKGL